MPELPEVETVRRGLARLLPNRIIQSVKADWPKSFPNSENEVKQFLINSQIIRVSRRGKVLIFVLSSGYVLLVHLKMTGQLVFRSNHEHFGAGHPTHSLIGKLPDQSTRVTIKFIDGSRLFFNDQRKFGWMRLLPGNKVNELDFFKKFGPEPLAKGFSWYQLQERLKRRPNTTIKAALLDQSVVAGVGNIYADEALWGAKIHPATLTKSLSANQLQQLHKELIFVLKLAIAKGGSTDKNYVDAEGKQGSYLNFAHVFRREGQTCPRCSNTIMKIRVASRGTHICPSCQQLKA
jgi:formamidopyrimidine-DNA glycosylase